MMRKKELSLIITFHTTAEAIDLERKCKAYGLKGRMIPVPRELSAGCGIAWCCEHTMEESMQLFMNENNIEYDIMAQILY